MLGSAQPVLHCDARLVSSIRADSGISEKTIRIPSGAKARVYSVSFTARLKSCPFKTSTYSEVPLIAEAKVVACQEAHHSN
jgi:hypothetical protein